MHFQQHLVNKNLNDFKGKFSECYESKTQTNYIKEVNCSASTMIKILKTQQALLKLLQKDIRNKGDNINMCVNNSVKIQFIEPKRISKFRENMKKTNMFPSQNQFQNLFLNQNIVLDQK